jgi:hypothetical protein
VPSPLIPSPPEVVPAPAWSHRQPCSRIRGPGRAPHVRRGAFLRSIVIPGWGQAAFGAYTRGGIYFSGWTGNWFMNFKNQVRLDRGPQPAGPPHRADPRRSDRRAPRRTPTPCARSWTPPTSSRATVRPTPSASDLQDLVRSREQQREDWIAWSLFWLLASGVDAFVTAHLSDFPAAIDLEPQGPDGASPCASRSRYRDDDHDHPAAALERDRPIGVFDSGFGGLTVARALARRLPRESILYFGDTARVPYGSKSPDIVRRFSRRRPSSSSPGT